jgi:hypothetical protein
METLNVGLRYRQLLHASPKAPTLGALPPAPMQVVPNVLNI